MWLSRHKYLADGTLSRYKARLVANGSTQLEGVHVDETFSLVVKPVTRDSLGLFSSQKKYTLEILNRAHMANCNPRRTPIDTDSKLRIDGDPVSNVTLYRSLAEAEYCGVANAVTETCWLRNLLRELHTPLSFATLVYCDNVNVVYLSCNPVQHQHTKHIEIDIHFVRDLVAVGQVRVLHVPYRYQEEEKADSEDKETKTISYSLHWLARLHELGGCLIEGGGPEGTHDREETPPPLTKEQIKGHVSALKSLIKSHNRKNKGDPIRLDFEMVETETHGQTVVKGKEVMDEDL
uniref:Ribonuclease H-like domain-containing protein n=1 Tax=Tanacetum cinerariifolium TaxID=118510 RepID=A0A6L2KXL1_TANCI|nr:ribonuclease H-like domain-containing protein [Tanacetum cinerariifolium]